MITLILITFCGCGYLNSLNEIPFVPMTEEEIKLAIQKEFYDENGEPRVEKWKENNYFRYITDENMKAEILQNTGKDGFDFYTTIKCVPWRGTGSTKGSCFLAEFKPYGYYMGPLRQNKNIGLIKCKFCPYPSPYKILDIPHEDRYVDPSSEGMVLSDLVAYRNGEFVKIENEALSKFFKDQKFTRYEKYDFTSNKWIKYRLNEKTNEWEIRE